MSVSGVTAVGAQATACHLAPGAFARPVTAGHGKSCDEHPVRPL